MITFTKKQLPKSTLQFLVTIPKEVISEKQEKAFKKLSENLVVEGFRKGKAPRNIAEKNISGEVLARALLEMTLSDAYREIVTKEQLKPIAQPKVEIKKAEKDLSWEVEILVPLSPSITLSDTYKEKLKKKLEEATTVDLWVPGKNKEEKKPASEDEKKTKKLQVALEWISKEVPCEVSDIVIDQEVERKLSALVDDIRKMGLTVDGYMKAKQTTTDEVKKQYKQEVEKTIQLEFLLDAIADKEKITVQPDELTAVFSKMSEPDKKQAQDNSYLYASLIRKQKTLDFLISL